MCEHLYFPPVLYPRAAVLFMRLYSDVHLELTTKTSLLTLSFVVDANSLKPKICPISAQILRVSFETYLKAMANSKVEEQKDRIMDGTTITSAK